MFTVKFEGKEKTFRFINEAIEYASIKSGVSLEVVTQKVNLGAEFIFYGVDDTRYCKFVEIFQESF